ncbi:hypothetical protein ABAZ39_18865 (plasmid) [Azospirillum argentinense]|uniref:Uncharacterized protein n=1 Tax=Azospirillum argentinense TaxID=2970906 RepID=A0A060DSS4_9PROT|nr:hypothetical protein ABAZ39_18865 [Azospirillum argentinense]EZQ06494.1 hypothetical protein ABAZ39_19235 [Azospirillum argentinense]
MPGAGRHSTSTNNSDHTVTSSGSNVVSSGTRWPCPGPSTIVPMLGIPFRDAAARIAALVKEQDALPDTPEADARSDEITEQWEVLGRAVLGSIPRTPADSVAVIDTALCPAIGPNMDRATKDLFQRVRGVLVQAALEAVQREEGPASKATGGNASTMIPGIGLTFTDAAARAATLIEAQNNLQGSEHPDAEAERALLSGEWGKLIFAILSTEPSTLADAVAVLDRLACPHTGIGGTDIEVEALTRLRDLLTRLVEQQEDSADRGQFIADVRRWLALEEDSTPEGAAASATLARQIATYQGEPTVAMAAKALLLWAGHSEGFDAALGKLRRPPAVAVATNEENALLFGLVHDALRAVPELGSVMAEPTNETESFSAGVAAFDGAAEKALCMPTAPTLAMLEAGATAGGIDLEQARTIYAAMVVAFAKEAA